MYHFHKLHNTFRAIAAQADENHTHINLYLHGGAALVLGTTCRTQTADIDVLTVLADRYSLFEAAQGAYIFDRTCNAPGMANRQDLIKAADFVKRTCPDRANAPDWLHLNYLTSSADTADFIPCASYLSVTGNGVSVWLAPAPLLFAMKITDPREKSQIDSAKLAIALNMDSPDKIAALLNRQSFVLPKLLGDDPPPKYALTDSEYAALTGRMNFIREDLKRNPAKPAPAIRKPRLQLLTFR